MKPTNSGCSDQTDPMDGSGMDEPLDRDHRGVGRRGGYHGHDEDAGQVLSATEAVGVPAGGGLASEPEGEGEREGGERVGDVVDRVTEQGNRSGEGSDTKLHRCRDAKNEEGDPQHPHALGAGSQLGVERPLGVVAVGDEESLDPTAQTARMFVIEMVLATMACDTLVALHMIPEVVGALVTDERYRRPVMQTARTDPDRAC